MGACMPEKCFRDGKTKEAKSQRRDRAATFTQPKKQQAIGLVGSDDDELVDSKHFGSYINRKILPHQADLFDSNPLAGRV